MPTFHQSSFLHSKRHCKILKDDAGFHHMYKGGRSVVRIDSNIDLLTVYICAEINREVYFCRCEWFHMDALKTCTSKNQ